VSGFKSSWTTSKQEKLLFTSISIRHGWNSITWTLHSYSNAGVKFYCQNCGREGHRRHYCPELKDGLIDRQFTCRLCGEKGHNRRTCNKLRISHSDGRVIKHHRCKICRQYGHNRRTCPQVISNKRMDMTSQRVYKCRLCQKEGHNSRTCPSRIVGTEHSLE